MNPWPFGQGFTYYDLFERLLELGCSVEEFIEEGEFNDTDGTPCPAVFRLARASQGRLLEYALTKYPTQEWVMPATIEAIEQALEINLWPIH